MDESDANKEALQSLEGTEENQEDAKEEPEGEEEEKKEEEEKVEEKVEKVEDKPEDKVSGSDYKPTTIIEDLEEEEDDMNLPF